MPSLGQKKLSLFIYTGGAPVRLILVGGLGKIHDSNIDLSHTISSIFTSFPLKVTPGAPHFSKSIPNIVRIVALLPCGSNTLRILFPINLAIKSDFVGLVALEPSEKRSNNTLLGSPCSPKFLLFLYTKYNVNVSPSMGGSIGIV